LGLVPSSRDRQVALNPACRCSRRVPDLKRGVRVAALPQPHHGVGSEDEQDHRRLQQILRVLARESVALGRVGATRAWSAGVLCGTLTRAKPTLLRLGFSPTLVLLNWAARTVKSPPSPAPLVTLRRASTSAAASSTFTSGSSSSFSTFRHSGLGSGASSSLGPYSAWRAITCGDYCVSVSACVLY
jgi:hypothetical protein